MATGNATTRTAAQQTAARLYDDPGPFASVYLDVTRNTEDGERIIEIRARDAVDELRAQGAPDEVLDRVRDALTANTHLPAPVSRMVVATERGVLLNEVTRVSTSRPVTAWDALPDLSSWLGNADTGEFILALVDHEGGDVASYSPATMQAERRAEVGGTSPWEHKIKGGAWSQLNFQRSTETVWGRNAEEVVAEIGRQLRPGVDLVIIGGDQDARRRVLDNMRDLDKGGQFDVVELSEGSREADGSGDLIVEEISRTIAARSVAQRLAAVHRLRDRMGQGHGATTGVSDTVDALVQGAVETLLLDPDQAAEQSVDPAEHPGLSLGSVSAEGPQRADRLLIALALLTKAEPVITRASTMGGASVAAVLRW